VPSAFIAFIRLFASHHTSFTQIPTNLPIPRHHLDSARRWHRPRLRFPARLSRPLRRLRVQAIPRGPGSGLQFQYGPGDRPSVRAIRQLSTLRYRVAGAYHRRYRNIIDRQAGSLKPESTPHSHRPFLIPHHRSQRQPQRRPRPRLRLEPLSRRLFGPHHGVAPRGTVPAPTHAVRARQAQHDMVQHRHAPDAALSPIHHVRLCPRLWSQ
jgi:hypothetical protein